MRDGIEIIRAELRPRRVRAVLFDWDGTLSLLREGWSAVMSEQMTAAIHEAGVAAPAEVIAKAVHAIVVGLNGRPTIVQMQALAAWIAEHGGRSADPLVYLDDYQRRLHSLIRDRYAAIETGRTPPEAWAVPGAAALLQHLRTRGLPVIVISGTAVDHVRCEADLLRLTPLADEWHAPAGNDPSFNKRDVIDQLLIERGIGGSELLAFGDGVVETSEVRRLDGVAIGVATRLPPERGVDTAKREQLIQAGADAIIADYEWFQDWLPRWLAEE